MSCGQAESTDSLLTPDHTETNTEDAKNYEKRDFPCDNWGGGGGGGVVVLNCHAYGTPTGFCTGNTKME